MGIFFTAGENKIRPGIYQRYENRGTGPLAAAVNGIVAAVYRSNWGPVGAVENIGADEAGTLSARLGGGAAATVDLVTEAFQGGATTVLAVRLGSGGTPGGMTLKDTTTDVPADAVRLTARCPGSRSFKITIREKLGEDTAREFLVTEGDIVRETLTFAASADGEVDGLLAAVNSRSSYFTAEKAEDYAGTGKLALVAVYGAEDQEDRRQLEAVVPGRTEYGILQEVVLLQASSRLSDAKKDAQGILAENGAPRHTITAKTPDVPCIRKGWRVRVEAGSLLGYYIVKGVTHNATDRTMVMELQLPQTQKKGEDV